MNYFVHHSKIITTFLDLSLKSKIFSFLAIYAVVLFACVFFFTLPLQKKINLVNSEITKLKQQEFMILAKSQSYASCLKSVSKANQKIKSCYKGKLSGDENLNFLFGCIKKNNLSCDEIKPVGVKLYGDVYKNTFSFNVWGNFKNILYWLCAMENDDHMVKISKLVLERGRKHQVKMQTTVKMFALWKGCDEKK